MKKVFALMFMVMVLMVGCAEEAPTEKLTESNKDEITGTNVPENSPDVTPERDASEEAISFETPKRMKIDTTYKMRIDGSDQITEATLYLVDNHMRMEGSSYGMTYVMIYNDDEQKTYMISDADKTVMVMANDTSSDVAFSPFDNETFFSSADEIARVYGDYEKTTYNGVPVFYVETEDYNDEVGTSGTIKMWLSQAYGYPVHMEMIANDETIMTSDSMITDDFEGDMSLFEIPTDYTLIDMNRMMDMERIDLDALEGTVETE